MAHFERRATFEKVSVRPLDKSIRLVILPTHKLLVLPFIVVQDLFLFGHIVNRLLLDTPTFHKLKSRLK